MVIQAGQQAVLTAATVLSHACWQLSNTLSSKATALAVSAAAIENESAMAKAIAAAKMSRSLAIGGSGAVRATVSKAPPSWAAAAAAPTYAVTFIVEAAPYQQSRVSVHCEVRSCHQHSPQNFIAAPE